MYSALANGFRAVRNHFRQLWISGLISNAPNFNICLWLDCNVVCSDLLTDTQRLQIVNTFSIFRECRRDESYVFTCPPSTEACAALL